MNKVILMGRLARDPELHRIQGENATVVARYSLAVDRKFKREGQPEADFFNCTSFGKQAEFVEKYLFKGTKIAIVGRIENNNYTNKNGEKVYSFQIIVEEVNFAEGKRNRDASSSPSEGNKTDNGFMNIPVEIEEDLPFN